MKLTALGLLVLLLLGIAGAVVAAPQTLVSSRVLYVVAAAFLLGLVLDFAGRSLCLVVPLSRQQRIVVAGSIGCQLAAMILLVTPFLAVPELPVEVRLLTGFMLAACAQAASAVLFMIYACNLSIELGRPDLARSPFHVLWFFGLAGGSFTSGAIALLILLVFVLLCPCLGWLIYAGLAILEQGWRNTGLPERLLGPVVRLVPTLFVSLLLYSPLYRYGRLLWQLTNAVVRRGQDTTTG